VQGTETYRRWIQKAALYAVAMTAAAAAAGVAFAAAGAGIAALWSDAKVPLAFALGAVALVYALHELDFIHIPVPGRDWQVPVEWVRGGYYQSAVVWGTLVGAGVFTRVTYAILPILLAWLFVSGNVLYGALAGAVYGATRAVTIYSSARSREPADVINLNERLMQLAPALHQAVGGALAAFAMYLLIAPLL